MTELAAVTRRSASPSRHLKLAGTVAVLAILAAACAGTSSGSSPNASSSASAGRPSGKVGSLLTIAVGSAPVSLNPSGAGPNALGVYITLSYDSLINWTDGNKFTPDLATQWGYVGTGNKTFRLTLRPGVKFSDGEPLTAQAVANSINYFKTSSAGPTGLDYQDITATATGPLQVTLTSTVPQPDFVELMTPFYLDAAIIAPKGVADPKLLQTQSLGTGEYILQPGQSVANDYYTYTANPHYWDPGAVHYKKIMVRVIADENSALEAMETGQVDLYIGGSIATSLSAQAAGISVLSATNYWEGLQLLDPEGKHFPELGNLKVRQAISYAIDRAAVAKAVYGSYATARVQPALSSWDGFDPALEKDYPYDPAKAKQLLAQAGYAKGFTLPVDFWGVGPFERTMEAIGGQLSKVGIQLAYYPQTSLGAMTGALYTGKYAAFDAPISAASAYVAYHELWGPKSNLNGFDEVDPTLGKLYATAASSTGAAATAGWTAFLSYLTQTAYTIPVLEADQLYYVSKGVSAGINKNTGVMDYTAVQPTG